MSRFFRRKKFCKFTADGTDQTEPHCHCRIVQPGQKAVEYLGISHALQGLGGRLAYGIGWMPEQIGQDRAGLGDAERAQAFRGGDDNFQGGIVQGALQQSHDLGLQRPAIRSARLLGQGDGSSGPHRGGTALQ